MKLRHSFALLLALPLFAAACATPVDLAGESEGNTESAFTKARRGERFESTARLNLREEPSSDAEIVAVLPLRTIITVESSTPDNGFYEVDTDEGKGWIHGQYLATGAQKLARDEDDAE